MVSPIGRQATHNDGFSAIEGLLILLVAVIVIGAGWYINRHDKQASQTKSGTSHSQRPPVQSDPYTGWKTYTVPSATLHFEYPPSGWQLNPATGPKGPLGLTPGTPETSLLASNGLYIDVLTDDNSTAPAAGNTVLLAQPIKTLGTTYYLDYIDAVGDHNVTYAALLTGPEASSPYPEIKMPGGANNRLVVSVAYQVSNGPGEKPLSVYQKDPAMQSAKLILASLAD